MKIVIETIPHEKQRYPTVGDYNSVQLNHEQVTIKVSELPNWKFEFLVAIHELIEVALCCDRNITEESITSFDEAFEAERVFGNVDEPGDCPEAPYFAEHQIATGVEKYIAKVLNVDWEKYNEAVNSL